MLKQSLNFTKKPIHCVLFASVAQYYNEQLWHFLNGDEQQRCQRFYHLADRQRFTVAHALKRHALSLLLKCSMLDIGFEKTETGKPYCNEPLAPHFNLSHSDDAVVLAFSSLAEIGVDIEPLDRNISAKMAPQILNADSYQIWQNCDPLVLLTHWTQKEAISKAIGLGLSMGFKSIASSGEQCEGEFYYEQRLLRYISVKHAHFVNGRFIQFTACVDVRSRALDKGMLVDEFCTGIITSVLTFRCVRFR